MQLIRVERFVHIASSHVTTYNGQRVPARLCLPASDYTLENRARRVPLFFEGTLDDVNCTRCRLRYDQGSALRRLTELEARRLIKAELGADAVIVPHLDHVSGVLPFNAATAVRVKGIADRLSKQEGIRAQCWQSVLIVHTLAEDVERVTIRSGKAWELRRRAT